jgi:hypothetical protein
MTEFEENRLRHVENAISDAIFYIDRDCGANRLILQRIVTEALVSKNIFPQTKKEFRDRYSYSGIEGIEPCQRIGAALLEEAGLSVFKYGPNIDEVYDVGELDMGRLEEVIATLPGATGVASDIDLGVTPLKPFVSEVHSIIINQR